MTTSEQIERIADQFETLLLKEPDLNEAMDSVAEEFERVGLLVSEGYARREDAELFVRDVIRDNDLIMDYLNLREERLRSVGLIRSLDEMMSMLIFQPRE